MPYKKGQSGNPGGRPKNLTTLSLTEAIRTYLKTHPREFNEIVLSFIASLKRGNFQAFLELWNRIDGKVTEKHELEAKIPITLVFQPVQPQLAQGAEATQIIEGEAREITDGQQSDSDGTLE